MKSVIIVIGLCLTAVLVFFVHRHGFKAGQAEEMDNILKMMERPPAKWKGGEPYLYENGKWNDAALSQLRKDTTLTITYESVDKNGEVFNKTITLDLKTGERPAAIKAQIF